MGSAAYNEAMRNVWAARSLPTMRVVVAGTGHPHLRWAHHRRMWLVVALPCSSSEVMRRLPPPSSASCTPMAAPCRRACVRMGARSPQRARSAEVAVGVPTGSRITHCPEQFWTCIGRPLSATPELGGCFKQMVKHEPMLTKLGALLTKFGQHLPKLGPRLPGRIWSGDIWKLLQLGCRSDARRSRGAQAPLSRRSGSAGPPPGRLRCSLGTAWAPLGHRSELRLGAQLAVGEAPASAVLSSGVSPLVTPKSCAAGYRGSLSLPMFSGVALLFGGMQ